MARENYIAIAPIRRIMKREGADLVSLDAVEFLRDTIEQKGKELVRSAVDFAKSDKRKRITKEDIKSVV